MTPIRIAIVGFGAIARREHLPALAADDRFALVATVDPADPIVGAPNFASLADLFAVGPAVDAVAICTPTPLRAGLARMALGAGKHVLLEKPPASRLDEAEALVGLAARHGLTLHASWHSRHAPGVEPARAWLAARTPRAVDIDWREDVQVFHPRQDWIFAPGGLGVFDPGVNALSIATVILPPFEITAAALDYPANRAEPIAAELAGVLAGGGGVRAAFDFRHDGPARWEISVETDDGARLRLADGGARLELDGIPQTLAPAREYPQVYDRFARLIGERRSEADLRPLRLAHEAFRLGRRRRSAAFDFDTDAGRT